MSSINQLVSEIAHSVRQADSVPVRRAIKLGIIHSRNELIRKSYSNHNYTDKVLQQRFKVSLVDVPDGDLNNTKDVVKHLIKRTSNKVPRPVRLLNNLPFHSIRTVGVEHPVEVAFVKEAATQYYKELPGMTSTITYDYINDYIYINIPEDRNLNNLGAIIIESVFEYPHLIETETSDNGVKDINNIDDNDEFFIPEDMVNTIKKLILETFNAQIIRDTNKVPADDIVR